MKKVLPMNKKVGRNISLPFYLDLWLREKFKNTECSGYIVKLILNDLKFRDPVFCKDFEKEIEN